MGLLPLTPLLGDNTLLQFLYNNLTLQMPPLCMEYENCIPFPQYPSGGSLPQTQEPLISLLGSTHSGFGRGGGDGVFAQKTWGPNYWKPFCVIKCFKCENCISFSQNNLRGFLSLTLYPFTRKTTHYFTLQWSNTADSWQEMWKLYLPFTKNLQLRGTSSHKLPDSRTWETTF